MRTRRLMMMAHLKHLQVKGHLRAKTTLVEADVVACAMHISGTIAAAATTKFKIPCNYALTSPIYPENGLPI